MNVQDTILDAYDYYNYCYKEAENKGRVSECESPENRYFAFTSFTGDCYSKWNKKEDIFYLLL